MNKNPILLRSLFALFAVAVFVWSMFPLQEADFYDTFRSVTDPAKVEQVNTLIEKAKAIQKANPNDFQYPSKALEAAADQTLDKDNNSLNLTDYMRPVTVKKMKLRLNSDVISMVRKKSQGAIHLGIDLNGGAEFLLELKVDEGNEEVAKNFDKFRDNAIETIRKRLEGEKLYECDISSAGANLISVRVPVVTKADQEKLEKLILRSAKLEFRLVHQNSAEIVQDVLTKFDAVKDTYRKPVEAFFNEEYVKQNPEMKNYEFMTEERYDSNGKRRFSYDIVSLKSEMDGKEVADAAVMTTQFGQREISLTFKDTGAKQFGVVTSNNVGRQLAIVLDGKLYSAPVLKVPILDGRCSISGSFSDDEATAVQNALVSGSMPFDIRVASRSDIEPSVGAETIQKSIWSGIIGTVLVMLFMVIYYHLAGMVANISLLVNALVMLGAIAAFDVTLTLPGIAGIILTIGMAVDANVLIYERMREEINGGKSVQNAVQIGFDKAFSAIFDSNLTTLFVALILFWQGSGTIKGFAITLAIGIFTTMFTAVFLTHIIFDFILRIAGTRLKSLSMLYFCKNPKIDFVGARKVIFCVSGAAIILSLVLMTVRGKDLLGIDFTGGSQIMVEYKAADATKGAVNIPSTEIEKYLKGKGYDAKAAYKTTTSEGKTDAKMLEIVVRNNTGTDVSEKLGAEIITEMDKAYPQVKFTWKSQTHLGALIGWEFTKAAIIALICACIGMIIYMIIRFQFSYSIAANIALFHDVIVSMGIYLALGGQLTLQVVASLLTLIGYSVNDTIVTFDRQRENIKLLQGKTYHEIVNISVNQTLGRTILTSLSVVLILVAQLVLGGEGIRDFIAVMLIGCIVGCYSSIFISPAITAFWHRKEQNIVDSKETIF